jgi:hypothetical protein
LFLSGVIYGINISLFNVFDIKILREIAKTNDDLHTQLLNFYFATGGFISCLVGSFLIRRVSRKMLNYILIILNILFTALLQSPSSTLTIISRLVIGFVCVFYTFLTPIMFKEYLPGNDSGVHGSFFFIGIAFGSCFSIILFTFVDSILRARLVLGFPIILEMIRFYILARVFNQESPRFACLQVLKRNPDLVSKLISERNPTTNETTEIEDITTSFYGLKEDDEDDIFDEELLPKTNLKDKISYNFKKSFNQNSIISKIKEDLSELAKKDKAVKYYFESFYHKDQYDIIFEFFFEDFIQIYHSKFISDNKIPWNIFSLMFDQSYRLQFFLILFLNFIDQMTGVNCLTFYSNSIFQAFSNDQDSKLLTTMIGNDIFRLNHVRHHLVLQLICGSPIHQSSGKKSFIIFRIKSPSSLATPSSTLHHLS